MAHKRILLVAITRLGDLLQASPAIIGLKRENPDSRLTVLVDKSFAPICYGLPDIDEVYEIDLALMSQYLKKDGEALVDAYEEISRIVEDLKGREFDYCLNISSTSYTALLIKMLGVPESRGWLSDDEGFRLITNPWARLFGAFVYHANRDYNSINLVDIVRCCAGVTSHPKTLVYNIPAEATGFGEQFIRQSNVQGSGPLICLQAGASQEKRQWSPARFAQTAEILIRELDARIVLTGALSEMPIAERLLERFQHPNLVSAVGQTKLGELASLLQAADVLVTGDTGPMHLAVAVGTPVVALFLASALCFETGPYSEGNIVLQPQITCNPCNPNLSCAKPDCHAQFSPQLLAFLTKLRLETPTEKVRELRIPADIADPRAVAIYASSFDSDHFLCFERLNGTSERNGFPGWYFEGAREAYRQLWKEEFEMMQPGREKPVLTKAAELEGLSEIVALSERGRELTEALQGVILDQTKPPRLLGEIGNELAAVDQRIEEVGLSEHVLGALVRMFVMEKENMRGNDPLKLASEMHGIYVVLSRRMKRFASLFGYYSGRVQGEERC